ncbi:hypothetical protein JHD48_07115 [Sulfurimonas sp. SAG-AH-194-I05]|nr:SiaB family protein kinase [Sulfurimonas sp. SAG-AH-194-I05]MDF1875500.1 hypothetical protein [Sulfurimonas sp. SAG-AH-194-I05]
MLNQSLYSYKDALDREGIIFTFCGPISHDIVEGVGVTLKSQMQEDDVSRTTAMKVFAIFIEQVQNVINYSQERNDTSVDMGMGIIVVGKHDNKHFIVGGNKIHTSKVAELEKNLKDLVKMDKNELKIFYKEKRKVNNNADSKGAGIGFIEMARKATQPLEYSFEKIDDAYSFFSIEANI